MKSKVDSILLIIVLSLLAIGLAMVFDASSKSTHNFFLQQVLWIAFGILGAIGMYRMDLLRLKHMSHVLHSISLILLFFLALHSVFNFNTPFSSEINGAHRWIVLNPQPFPSLPFIGRLSFQPSDLAKFTLIIYLSSIIGPVERSKDKRRIFAFFFVMLLTAGLVLAEPDFGTALIILGISILIYIASGAPLIYMFVALPVVFLSGLLLAFSSEYRRQRIMTFLRPESIDPLKGGYHIKQVLIAIGSGGLIGLGFGQSRQKYAYIPEGVSDSIYAIFAEEFGFVGSAVLVLLFMALLWRCVSIAKKTNSPFLALVIVGIASWIGLQVFMNLFAMVGLIPLTGIPLPFISYGGSSIVFTLLSMGLVFNIARNNFL